MTLKCKIWNKKSKKDKNASPTPKDIIKVNKECFIMVTCLVEKLTSTFVPV